MSNLILPELITIRLIKSPTDKFSFENIAVYIKTFARHKNDFNLGPFLSDRYGVIKITKADLESEVESTYEAGIMDYANIGDNFSFVEIRLYSNNQIQNMIESRSNNWKSLLTGEKKRWKSIEALISALKESNNKKLLINDRTKPIRTELDGSCKNYEFEMQIYSED